MKKVLVFAPHPDDAEYYAGGTLALWAQQGNQIMIVTVTDGSKGSYHHSSAELIPIRQAEAKAAARQLGAVEVVFLGHPDQELDLLPPCVLREQFVRLIRQHKPDVLVVEDVLFTEEPHPDHRAVARAAADAVAYASLPLVYPAHKEEGLEPFFVTEKVYYSENLNLANQVVDISTIFERKIAALAAHQSQVEFLVEDILFQAQAAGLEEHEMMRLARQNPLMALTFVLRQQAVEAGLKAGYELGEAFRYERYHPLIEGMLVS